MKIFLLFVSVILFSVPAFAAAAESTFDCVMRTGVLRCGIIPWPPGAEVDPVTKEIRGPTKELFDAIIRLTGWKPEFVEVALGEIPLDLEHGKIDSMCADGPWTITNIKFVDLTDPAQMMMEVAEGKADAVILDPVTAEGFMKNNPGKINPLSEKEPLAVYPFGMSVRRGESRLQQTLSRATEMAINIGLVDQKLDLYDPTRRTVYSPIKPYEAPK